MEREVITTTKKGPTERKRKKIKLKKYYIKDVGKIIYAIGVCRQRIDEDRSQNESKSHRNLRYIISIVSILSLVKYSSLLIYYYNQEEDIIDEKMLFWFGDLFFFQPQIRMHFNVALLAATIRLLQTQLLYYQQWRNGKMKYIPNARLFQVFSGMISSQELGLGWKDVIKLMRM